MMGKKSQLHCRKERGRGGGGREGEGEEDGGREQCRRALKLKKQRRGLELTRRRIGDPPLLH